MAADAPEPLEQRAQAAVPQAEPSSLVACPFCGEPDFDLPGLKRHVVVGDCAVFEATEALRGRAAGDAP